MRQRNAFMPNVTGRLRLWRAAIVPVALLALPAGCSSPPSTLTNPDPGMSDGGPGEEVLLQPGHFLSPLVQRERLQGERNHLHVDEVRLRDDGLLLQCSYTFGVIDTNDPDDMRYLSQSIKHVIPNDTRSPGCIHLAIDGNIVYTTHRGNIRNPAFLSGWDITDPTVPVQIPVLQEPGISYEGIDFADGNIYVGLHENGLGVYRNDGTNNVQRIGTATGLVNAWGVTVRGNTVFVADGPGGLVTVDVTDPANPTVLGRVVTGGHASAVEVNDNIAYVAAGSNGMVVVDVSNLASPTIIGQATMPGSAIRLSYSDGHVFVAAWNDARVYDVSVPAEPRFLGAVRLTHDDDDILDPDRPQPTSRILGITARGNDVFIGNWHVIYSYQFFPDRTAPNIRLPESALMTDFGPVEVGDSKSIPFKVTNQGTEPLTLTDNWVYGSDFTVTPRQARVAPGESVTLTLTFTPTTTDLATGYLHIPSDDPFAPLRAAYLVGNLPGLGVGQPLPPTSGVLLDGEPWSSSQTEGQVVLLAYFATF